VGATNIVCVRISKSEHRREHSAWPLFRFSANIATACVLGGVLDVIDADRFAASRAGTLAATSGRDVPDTWDG
jgi:hypothetical protein